MLFPSLYENLLLNGFDLQPSENDDDFSFIMSFIEGTSISELQTTGLAAGRVSYHGGPYGINEPAVDKCGLFGCGAFENIVAYPDDLSVSAWNKVNFSDSGETTTTPDGDITKWWTMGEGYVYQTRSFTVGSIHTYGFWAKADRPITIGIRKPAAASSAANYEQVDLTTDWKFFSYSGVADNASGNFLFENRTIMNFSGDMFKVAVSKIRMYKAPFLYPYVDGLSPENFSDADQGYKFPVDAQLLTSLNGTDGTDAQGKLTVKWRPMFSYDQATSSNLNITSATNAIMSLCYSTNAGSVRSNDGTTIVSSNTGYQADTEYTVTLQYGPHPDYANALKLQLTITDGTTTWQSGVVDFDGSFNPTDYLSFFFDNEYPQYIKSINIAKEPGWAV